MLPVHGHRRSRRLSTLALVSALAVTLALITVEPAAAQSSPSVQRGAQVFNANCQVCHGVYAQGRMGPPLLPLPPEIAQAPRDALIGELTGLIRSGIPGRMPRFEQGQVADQDVGALVDWFLFQNNQPRAGRSFYEALAPATTTQSSDNVTYVAATKHTISFGFKQFYDAQGGAARFGNPLTEEYAGYSEVDGSLHTMQLFEKARFELVSGDVQLSTNGAAELELRTHFFSLGEGGPPTP
jgi:mono/diheme cytochrome c family protein